MPSREKWNFGLHGSVLGKMKRADLDSLVFGYFRDGKSCAALGQEFQLSRDTVMEILRLVTGFRSRHGGCARTWALECAPWCLSEYERRMIDFETERARAQQERAWLQRAAERRRIMRGERMRAELHRRTGI